MNQSQAFAYFLIPEKCDRPVKATNSIWVRQQTKMSEIVPKMRETCRWKVTYKQKHNTDIIINVLTMRACGRCHILFSLRSYRLGTRVALSSLVPRFSFGNEASLVLGTYKIYREYRVDLTIDSIAPGTILSMTWLWPHVGNCGGTSRVVSATRD